MSHAHPRPVRSLSVRLKHKGRAKVLESEHLTSRRGKTILFYLYRSPRIGGPMRGLKDVSVARKPSTFPDVRGQVEDIILGNREAKTASDHLTPNPKQERLFKIRHPKQCFNGAL
ncbi:hypothetical protein TNIN_342361 [Trichonephila inaurata madagascariensis]|uniref:Uncharacterized protein n=1 Tax=Trichonephila inaurata madagascariensis TaxID=2747483 RepID=A0A8X6WNV8_9ARAC|nr:hypothetical protein TNIN_342361 [Trichonephila inaurata madagascariensis]